MKEMATIRDIAKITGFSITTVSRVINGHPYVDEQKRAAILAVMEELDYKPNKIAQKLSSGKPIILESSYRLSITPSLTEF